MKGVQAPPNKIIAPWMKKETEIKGTTTEE